MFNSPHLLDLLFKTYEGNKKGTIFANNTLKIAKFLELSVALIRQIRELTWWRCGDLNPGPYILPINLLHT